jgi:DNA primase large subunit
LTLLIVKEVITIENEMADRISHFMFRLAFCKTEEQRAWFLKYEAKLFLKRLVIDQVLLNDKILAFLRKSGRNLKKIVVNRNRDIADWENFTSNIKEEFKQHNEMTFYATDFESVSSLLATRKYFLRGGSLYIPEYELPYCVQVIFKDHLGKALIHTMSKEADIASDPRLSRLLTKIRGWQATHGYASWKGKVEGRINIAELDSLSKQFYPPCAKVLHNGLKANNHLKHDGRMQYGLYLKGIGLTLEESIAFWRTEFTKKVSPEVFQKKYMYNIRHNYGAEGKRADYVPWSCTKILNLPPPTEGQYHGCPFKTYDATHLLAVLRQYKLSDNDLQAVMKAKNTYQYELACLKLFEAINPNAKNSEIGRAHV